MRGFYQAPSRKQCWAIRGYLCQLISYEEEKELGAEVQMLTLQPLLAIVLHIWLYSVQQNWVFSLACLLSCVQLFAVPWVVAHQIPLSMEFSRQEYWSGLPFSSPGNLLNPGIKSQSPALQADSLRSELPESHHFVQQNWVFSLTLLILTSVIPNLESAKLTALLYS